MRLHSLYISRKEKWQDPNESLHGTIKVKGVDASIEVALNEAACQQILLVAGDAIKAGARDTADFLASEATSLLLEAPKEPAP